MTTTTTNNATLAARAAGLLTKQAAYGAAQKALEQALTARRVYPALAEDYGQQLGLELPLKTRDFIRVVTHLLAASEKPLKGVVSKRKSEILAVLSDLVAALTDTDPMALPSWAIPKERSKKTEAEAVSVDGTLQRANAEALANESAEAMAAEAMAEAKDGTVLAKAVALVVANVGALTEAQREALTLALAQSEPALV